MGSCFSNTPSQGAGHLFLFLQGSGPLPVESSSECGWYIFFFFFRVSSGLPFFGLNACRFLILKFFFLVSPHNSIGEGVLGSAALFGRLSLRSILPKQT